MAKKKLDLGCGNHKLKNAIGFDCIPLEGVDVVGDLRDPLPFKDNEFDIILLNNVLEHFDDITPILKETHRICKPTGKIFIMVPYYNSPLGCIDPTHKKYFHYNTIDYYSDNSKWNFYFDFKFKIIKKRLIPTRIGTWIPKKLLLKASHYFGNVVNFLLFVIQPIKNEKNEIRS